MKKHQLLDRYRILCKLQLVKRTRKQPIKYDEVFVIKHWTQYYKIYHQINAHTVSECIGFKKMFSSVQHHQSLWKLNYNNVWHLACFTLNMQQDST